MVITFAFVLVACGSEESTEISDDSSSEDTSNEDSSSEDTNEEESAFVPERDVELVVPYSAGGGSDTNGRFVANVIKEHDLIDSNLMVVNKPGGSGAVGNAYVNSKSGDNHTISTWVPGQSTSALLNDAEVELKDVTPLGTLALDSFLLLVDQDSPYETVEDFISAAEENPGEISVGGSGKGGEDHLVYHMLQESAGIEMKYVTFQGGGESLSNLMGGHVDAIFSNPNEVMSQIEAGELRPLATTSENKLSGSLESVPTFADAGHPDVYYEMFRGYAGPPDMSEEAIAYWEDVLKQVSETEMYQEEYIDKFNLTSSFKDADESKKFFKDHFNQSKEILTEMGMVE